MQLICQQRPTHKVPAGAAVPSSLKPHETHVRSHTLRVQRQPTRRPSRLLICDSSCIVLCSDWCQAVLRHVRAEVMRLGRRAQLNKPEGRFNSTHSLCPMETRNRHSEPVRGQPFSEFHESAARPSAPRVQWCLSRTPRPARDSVESFRDI